MNTEWFPVNGIIPHNPEVAGSSPVSATIKPPYFERNTVVFLTFRAGKGRSSSPFGAHLAHRGLVFICFEPPSQQYVGDTFRGLSIRLLQRVCID